MNPFCFATDLHGKTVRFDKLFAWIGGQAPAAVLLGGDLLPSPGTRESRTIDNFVRDYLAVELMRLRRAMGSSYPRVGVLMGNDDPRVHESDFRLVQELGLWTLLHGRVLHWADHPVAGYAFVPPTPFACKDWEKYDVSRYVEHGCSAPTEGSRSVEPDYDPRYSTMSRDLEELARSLDPQRAIVLFHAPPHRTVLDRASLDAVSVDGVPVDVHVGSIAIRRFIEAHQPWITLHGHVHESVSNTGQWRQRLGRTTLMGAAHDGPELAMVVFDADAPEVAERVLL